MIKITSSDLRKRMGEALSAVQHDTRLLIERHGRPVAVLLSMADYEKYSDAMDVTEGWFTQPNRFARYEDGLVARAKTREERPREAGLLAKTLPAVKRRLASGKDGLDAQDVARLEAHLAGLKGAVAQAEQTAEPVETPTEPAPPPERKRRWWCLWSGA